MVGCDERRERRQDGNTPNPLLRTPVAEFVACRRTPLPPRGEAVEFDFTNSYHGRLGQPSLPRPLKERTLKNMPFYQTNPPFFGGFFVATNYEDAACAGNRREKSVGSFWKTNPPVRLRQGYGATRPTRRAVSRGSEGMFWQKMNPK